MNRDQVIEELKHKQEIIPDEYDGSYELMREIVASYAKLDNLDKCGIDDMNAVYAMAIGTWRLNTEKKKDYVQQTCLPESEQSRLVTLLDKVWDNSSREKYIHCRHDNRPSIGMFGTAFYDFGKATSEDVRKFIEMLVDIRNLDDDEEIFSVAEKLLNQPFKGMQAASASVMLHCFKYMTFPILNNNAGHGTIYSFLGVTLDRPKESTSYIGNCRKIKAFRDENFSFKNYRILDLVAWEVESAKEALEGVKQVSDNEFDHNIILYGPPGTGKTYNTMAYAVAIIERKTLEEVKVEASEDYTAVKERYEEYKKNDQIAFTTFHQSFGYEEFIEGIKPKVDAVSTDIEYTIKDGIFKSFCEKATRKKVEVHKYDVPEDAAIWKVTIKTDVRQDCFENNRVRIGWGMDGDGANGFVNDMSKGDIIITTDGSRKRINGIAIVTSDEAYEYSDKANKTTRDVEWLARDIDYDITDINDGKMLHRMTVARVPKMSVADIIELAKKENSALDGTVIQDNTKPYVFIIDEINRGNISKIFGELITLIESTKRKGAIEETSAILPYTEDSFSVPANVYILGTMNTADRSIALMDTALRRRFSFEEMMPEPDVLRDIHADIVTQNDESLDVAKMLEVINKRIEYLYDREHTIGHAFFTCLKDDPTIDRLAAVFEKSVIPLLQEYFYEDYSKIQLVLGDNGKTGDNKQFQFIRDDKINVTDVFNGNPEVDIPEKKYSIQKSAFRRIESYKLIGKGL